MNNVDKDLKWIQIVDAIETNGNNDDDLLAQLAQEGDALSMLCDAECMLQAVVRDSVRRSISNADMEAAYSRVMGRIEAKHDKKARTVTMAKWWLAIAATVCLAFIASVSLWKPTPDTEHTVASSKQETTTQLKSNPVHRRVATPVTPAPATQTSNAALPQRLLNALGLEPSEVATESNTITTKSGKSADMVLPDGTKVWLYADSKITYPKAFSGKERTVFLEGQAEFDVTHDPDHPFVVMTNKLDARVLGTEINVCAYPDEAEHVALIRGIVVVTARGGGKSVRLNPGEGATLGNNGLLSVAGENMERYLKWKEGFLYFDNEPLNEVAYKLGKWYNVQIEFDNAALRQTRVHFSCDRNESLPRVIELINHFGYFQAAMKGDALCFSEKK